MTQPYELGPVGGHAGRMFPGFNVAALEQARLIREGEAAHRIVVAGIVIYFLMTGASILLLQAVVNGAMTDSYGPMIFYVLASLAHDGMRILPLFLWGRSKLGLLHPIIVIVTIYPLLRQIPSAEVHFAPLLGLLSGLPLNPPEFLGSEVVESSTRFLVYAKLDALGAAGLATMYAAFSICERTVLQRRAILPAATPVYDNVRLTTLLVGLIFSMFAGMLYFIWEFRGGLDAHVAALGAGRFSAFAGIGPLVAASKLGVVALFAWVMFDPRVVRTPLFIAALVVAAGTAFLMSGSRGDVMAAFIGAGLCWSIRTGRIPIRAAMIVAPLLLFLYGALFVLRIYQWSGGEQAATIYDRAATTELSDVVTAGTEESQLRATQHGAAPVMMEGPALTGGYLWGQTYAAAFVWFVPRIVWPEKPRGAGSLYAQLFVGTSFEGYSVPIGQVAEAYWNFWIPGVFLIFGLHGLITYWVYYLYKRFGADPFMGTAYVVYVTQFAMSADHMVPFFHMLLLIFFLRMLALALTVDRNQPGRPLSVPG